MEGPPGTGPHNNDGSMGPPGMGNFPPMPPPPGAMPPGGMPPGGMPPGGMPPGGMPPGGMPPGGMPPGGMPPGGMPPGGLPPSGMPPGGMPPGGMPPPMGPPGTMPRGMGPPPMGPPGMGPPRMPPGHYNQGMDMGPPGMGPPPNMGPPGMGPPPNMGPPSMGHWDNQGPPGWGRQGRGDGPPGWDDHGDEGDNNDHDDEDQGPPQGPPSLPSLLTMKIDTPEEFRNKPLPVGGVVLPKALEEALAYKDQRQAALGDEDVEEDVDEEPEAPPAPVISAEYDAEEDDPDSDDDGRPQAPRPPIISKAESSLSKANKNKRKKKKKKAAKQKRREDAKQKETIKESERNGKKSSDKENEKEAEIEYVQESIHFHELEPMYRQFHRVLEAFKVAEKKDDIKEEGKDAPRPATKPQEKVQDQFAADEEAVEKSAADEKERLSKRKLKKLSRLSVAELKQLVARPDVVEMYDVTARDPKLLVQLKAHRNTVQVPRHWCYKRKYLQGKRGIEKPPFDLPDFIKKTGIMEMRASLQDKDDTKTLKAKMRERARPKLGKIDIDYQKLHDAFFKWQTKPRMTIHGDLYYEGKEFETRLREKKPGDLSEELRTALGMPVGPGSHKVPPPWLIAQQRYGPPPSYPNLKIPGLNAPIPEGCAFGYHAGGWGKPPVDEHGKPLYGDVFGHHALGPDDGEDQDIDRTMWGELESESEEESEEEESEEEGEGEADASGAATPGEGLVTPLGASSVPPGVETPDTIELRKKKVESDLEGGDTPALYQVVPERRVGLTAGMMASTHVYDLGAANPEINYFKTKKIMEKNYGLWHIKFRQTIENLYSTGEVGSDEERRQGRSMAMDSSCLQAHGGGRGRGGGGGGGAGAGDAGVEVALDPSELELEPEAVAARYERHLRETRPRAQEDLSDMLADHVARQKVRHHDYRTRPRA
ncbi:hypothetical protein MSG28_006796 [Choristoneura fumiferana]|uniref:Uncharacterized protein n=1 Tax=Choristoneura fumiferana TaxID=7141 RepID=A0ACC0JL53_CHOFU|nr:hypothetical protein MSG28_006796 [Choristoneura fumiferana]